MPLAADDLARRLLHRDVTPQRLRKLKRLIANDTHRDAVIQAVVEQADAETAQRVREAVEGR